MSGGDYRERDLLWLLRDGLPDSFDVFHGLTWSAMHGAFQAFGELDLTIVSPNGHLLVLEVKAGKVFTQDGQLLKNYGRDGTKDVGHQVRRQYGALRSRLAAASLADVYVDTMLVLPDHILDQGTLAYPRERIIDATQMDLFCSLVQGAFSPTSICQPDRERLIDFLSNRFGVAPNVDAHIGQIQRLSTQLSSGLATWVPRISQDNQVYVVEATAGSGKTQLALTLLRDACLQNQRARYVCPLFTKYAETTPRAKAMCWIFLTPVSFPRWLMGTLRLLMNCHLFMTYWSSTSLKTLILHGYKPWRCS